MGALFWFVAPAAAAAMTVAAAGLALASAIVGRNSPALVAPELNGQNFDLAQLRGKVVIIDFWATWCPPCRKEMPALNAFYRHYHDKGLDVIALSADRPRDRSDVVKVMQSFSYPAAMLHDAKANGFGEPSELPTTYVVDAQGIVRAKLTPDEKPVTEQTLAAVVLPLLRERTPTQGATQGH